MAINYSLLHRELLRGPATRVSLRAEIQKWITKSSPGGLFAGAKGMPLLKRMLMRIDLQVEGNPLLMPAVTGLSFRANSPRLERRPPGRSRTTKNGAY